MKFIFFLLLSIMFKGTSEKMVSLPQTYYKPNALNSALLSSISYNFGDKMSNKKSYNILMHSKCLEEGNLYNKIKQIIEEYKREKIYIHNVNDKLLTIEKEQFNFERDKQIHRHLNLKTGRKILQLLKCKTMSEKYETVIQILFNKLHLHKNGLEKQLKTFIKGLQNSFAEDKLTKLNHLQRKILNKQTLEANNKRNIERLSNVIGKFLFHQLLSFQNEAYHLLN
jgi:hypothetical protein